MSAAATLKYGSVGGCVVLVQAKDAPSDEEWERYIEAALPWARETARLLVVTSGGAPSPRQRARMNELASHMTAPRVAVVTSSTFARGVLMAISLFSKAYRGFEPAELGAALDHLQVHGTHRDDIWRAVDAWSRELGVAPPHAP